MLVTFYLSIIYTYPMEKTEASAQTDINVDELSKIQRRPTKAFEDERQSFSGQFELNGLTNEQEFDDFKYVDQISKNLNKSQDPKLQRCLFFRVIFQLKDKRNMVKEIRDYIRQTFSTMVPVLFYTYSLSNKEKPNDKQFKLFVCLNLFSLTFRMIKWLNKYRGYWPYHIDQCKMITIVETQLEWSLQRLEQRFLQGNIDKNDADFKKDTNIMRKKLLKIQRRNNQDYDFFILYNVRYSDHKNSKTFIFEIIKKCLQISDSNKIQSEKFYQQFQKFNMVLEKFKDFQEIDKKPWLNYFQKEQPNIKPTSTQIGKKLNDPITIKQKDLDEFIDQVLRKAKYLKKFSHLLRILTKFIENLVDIINKPQNYTTEREWAFKDINNEYVHINQYNNTIPSLLLKNLEKLHDPQNLSKKELEQIKLSFFKEQINLIFFQDTYRNGEVGFDRQKNIASQIFQKLIKKSVEYLEKLIEVILKAGQVGQHKINLLVFNVGDLFRSRMTCRPNEFSNIIQTLNKIQQPFPGSTFVEQKYFRMIRLIDKITNPQRSILLNYVLLGKHQCQFQLNAKQNTTQEQIQYNYSHMIYELKRGQFGIISEIASMIVELYDPSQFKLDSFDKYKVQRCQEELKRYPVKKQRYSKFSQSFIEKNLFVDKYPFKPKWTNIFPPPENKQYDPIHIPIQHQRRSKQIIKTKADLDKFQSQYIKLIHLKEEITLQDIQKLDKYMSLQRLILSGNKLASIGSLNLFLLRHQLRQLSITKNNITSINQFQLYKCQKLQILNLSYNLLVKEQVCLLKFPRLRQLNLSNNLLRSFKIFDKPRNPQDNSNMLKSCINDLRLQALKLSSNLLEELIINMQNRKGWKFLDILNNKSICINIQEQEKEIKSNNTKDGGPDAQFQQIKNLWKISLTFL